MGTTLDTPPPAACMPGTGTLTDRLAGYLINGGTGTLRSFATLLGCTYNSAEHALKSCKLRGLVCEVGRVPLLRQGKPLGTRTEVVYGATPDAAALLCGIKPGQLVGHALAHRLPLERVWPQLVAA